MYLNIIFIPLISAVGILTFGRFIGFNGSKLFSCILAGINFILSIFIFYEVGLNLSPVYIYLFNWFESYTLSVQWGFQFDAITSIMLIVVIWVSSFVHLYSTDYMSSDPHLSRFMSYLSLFTFFMIILISADNYLQLFIGWEGVGLCSYLLINFWWTRLQANKSAVKAMIVNRIGDIGLSIAIFNIYISFGSISYSVVFSLTHLKINSNILIYSIDTVTLISILLLIGAIGKSAQLGLHTWLPDAMEGPTPVSALIHAATMVTAGIFVIIKSSPLIEYSQISLIIILGFGSLTAFFAASIGTTQNDLKRVIAYSTCSQLGYMLFSCGLSNYNVALFHLMNHAFFKALLFLCAGAIIHSVMDEQDMRKLGGLISNLPITYSLMLIGSMSLMGFPYLTGFFSKDLILEVAYSNYTITANFSYWLGVFSAGLTAFYSFRLLLFTFIWDSNIPKRRIWQIKESKNIVIFILTFLSVCSILWGYLFKDLMVGVGSNFFDSSIYINHININIFEAEFINWRIKLIPILFSSLGMIFSFLLYLFIYKYSIKLRKELIWIYFYIFLNQKWGIDIIYNNLITKNMLLFGYHISYKLIDRGILEKLGPSGSLYIFTKIAKLISILQSGYLYHYVFYFFTSLTFFLTIFFFQINYYIYLPILILLLAL